MKYKKLDELKKMCETLSHDITVFGEGSPDAAIMLVGEAPGAKEEELRKPFVGQAGKNLDEFLEILELDRENIYITNTVKIRPYKISDKTKRKSNRPPSVEEIKRYREILLKEIEIIKPKVIVTLGNHSLRSLYDSEKVTIGEVHGTIIQKGLYALYPLYHPAAVIYNRALREVYLNDLVTLKDLLKQP